jgi:hypothetical protein
MALGATRSASGMELSSRDPGAQRADVATAFSGKLGFPFENATTQKCWSGLSFRPIVKTL